MSTQATGDPADDPDRADGIDEDSSVFSSLIGHFYRGEIERMTTWRSRLDQTTNWAVVVMAAILTWAFSSQNHPHYVLLIGALAIGTFMFIEGQRYQEYDVWRSRVRLLQQDLFADTLTRSGPVHEEWRDQLGTELRDPTVHIPLWKALGHRLQRVYFPLFSVVLASWLLRITVFVPNTPWYESATVAAIPGTVIVGVIFVFYGGLIVMTVLSVRQSTKREFENELTTERT